MTFLPPKLDRELMRASYAEATRQRTNYWRPDNGPNKIRVLPGWPCETPIQPFVPLYQHFLGGEEKKSYTCPATPGINRTCPICKVSRNLKKQSSEVEQQMGKDIGARQSFLWNILVRGKEGEGVKVFSAPGSAHQLILGYAQDDTNWPNFLDFEKGADIIVEKTGSGLQTRYSVRIANPACLCLPKLGDAYKLFESAPDLRKFLKAESEEVLLKALRKAQDLDDEPEPVDDPSAVQAAVQAAVARATRPVVSPKAPVPARVVVGMGLAPESDTGAAEPEGEEQEFPADPDSAPMEEVQVDPRATVHKAVETASGAVATVKETAEAEVAVPSTNAAKTTQLGSLKARLNARLNKGA
jgi:hypothetical protein